ncbi:eCIS core domain-containing protein [Streptomyces kasugaensis]|uniref:eCIS core domain-containing protein n=1 Tax=Streptomyces kasugaensis TaxID=1946 RepID=UPI0013EF661A|nr:DUF4157 domain-containing protein [Streptomyces kasugaensis]
MALEQEVRSWLEGSFGVDIGQVRIHTGAKADGLARAFGAEAFTVGADIFFRDGCFNPGSGMGRWLLAHEVAHAVQQGGGSGAADAERVQPYDDLSEYAADEAATLVVSGRKMPGPAAAPQRLTDAATMLVQCHSSWEHRMLGDCNTNSLDVVAKSLNKSQGDSGAFLNKLRQLLLLWQTDPESVTEAQMHEHFPDIRAIRMQGSGLLVTYGELNTLADYLPQPAVLDAQPRSILLPILQSVRQEAFNKIGAAWLLNAPGLFFDYGVIKWSFAGWAEKIVETSGLDYLTRDVGVEGVGHYSGLLARNACHFAPYSWHRWYQFHMISRDYAMKSWQAGEGSNGENRYKAWLYHGYADHFLQDSFAAGHLVNKTSVMQWFVEWVADKWIPTGDWEQIQTMTTALQPGLAPRSMYTSWPYTGTVKDPETGQEMSTYEARRAASGVSGSDLGTAYSNYLTFLTNSVTQMSTAAVHDYYNDQSLWVSSPARTAPYQIWGDDTLLKSGDGVRIASETAKMSQQAIFNILANGNHGGLTPETIRDQFPTKAGTNSSSVIDLQDWQASVHDRAVNELFGSAYQRIRYAFAWTFAPRLGKVSLDDNIPARHPVHHWIRRGSNNWYEAPSPRWGASTAPTLCEYNSKLYAAFAAPDGTLVWNRYSAGQWEWEIPQPLGPAGQSFASNFAPTLTVWNNRLYCAYIDRGDRTIRLNYYNGSVWSTPEQVPGTGSSIDSMTPALAGIGNSLFLVFRGVEGAGSTNFKELTIFGWGAAQSIPDWNTASPVAACGVNGFLRVARRGIEFRINVATRQYSEWVKTQSGNIDVWRTQAGPAMATDGSQLWMAYFGPDRHVHVGRGTASPAGSTSWAHDFSITEDYSMPEAPGLAYSDGQIHVMFRY